jgi:hypothetical protein
MAAMTRFLEDDASLWLLHYQLIKTGLASTYNIIFNEFRKEKLFFNKDTFVNYLKRIREAEKHSISMTTQLQRISLCL